MPITDVEKRRTYDREWRDQRREQLNAARRARYALRKVADPEAHEVQRAFMRKWRQENQQIVSARKKAYETEHADARRKRKRAYDKSRLASDPVYKLNLYLRKRLNLALKNNSKAGSAVRLLGCSIDDFKARLEAMWSPGMSWDNYGDWHIDHIQPLAAFDLLDKAQLAVACHFSNLQPLWKADNLRKGAGMVQTGGNPNARGEQVSRGSPPAAAHRSVSRETLATAEAA
jgi:hypothetical protein